MSAFLLKPESEKDEKPAETTVTATSLNELDLDKELLAQYIDAKNFLKDVKHDSEIPLNQKAQILNTITSILQNIIKMQQDLHSVERMKVIENTLIETLKNHEQLRDAFLKDYEKALGKAQ